MNINFHPQKQEDEEIDDIDGQLMDKKDKFNKQAIANAPGSMKLNNSSQSKLKLQEQHSSEPIMTQNSMGTKQINKIPESNPTSNIQSIQGKLSKHGSFMNNTN